jgi:hypothetical protein
MARKQTDTRRVNTSLTIDPAVNQDGAARAKALGLSFSAYIEFLVRADLQHPAPLATVRTASGQRVLRLAGSPADLAAALADLMEK